MKLSEKQYLFFKLSALLDQKIIEVCEREGWYATMGDAFRDPRVHGAYGDKKSYASAYSNHKVKLARDVNLIDPVSGTLLGTAAHAEIGKYWKNLHPLCEWGGEPGRHDANHYSLHHDGRW